MRAPRLGWLGRRGELPESLRAALLPEEEVQFALRTDGGELLAVSRFALHLVLGEQHGRWGWESISKATLSAGTLTVTAAETVAHLDGLWVTADAAPRTFRLTRPHRLTDVVHQRVRRSVAASRRLDRPAGGGWVALRRIPGRDGLQAQLRLDPGTRWPDPELAQAASRLAAELTGPGHPS